MALESNVRDILGDRGEIIFFAKMTKFHSNKGPIFRPRFLGEKWPSVDFIIELLGIADINPYFFVQVRATRLGYTLKDRRLKIQVSEEKVKGIYSYPAPTYIVGVDDLKEQAFVVSANGENLSSLSSVSTAFPINKKNRIALWNEVRDFWQGKSHSVLKSRFADTDWK